MSLQILHVGLERLAEKYPHYCLTATLAGFGASILTWMKVLTVVFGFAGAVVGFIAGYYTLRVQRRSWLNPDKKNDEKS